jgi:hypothetical protein
MNQGITTRVFAVSSMRAVAAVDAENAHRGEMPQLAVQEWEG